MLKIKTSVLFLYLRAPGSRPVFNKKYFSDSPSTGFRAFLDHPAGPKTIFFWAPLFKWGLVFAGLKDINRPPETLSISQLSSLAITSLVWSRYSLVIIPKNYSLFSVNVFLFFVNAYQIMRYFNYQQEKGQKESKK